MQNFDPVKLHERVQQLEKLIFGHDVPDYVREPSADEPFPPINQADSGEKDRFGQAIMRDVYIHKPGLLDVVNVLNSKVHGVEPAAVEGGAVNAAALVESLAASTETKSRKSRAKAK